MKEFRSINPNKILPINGILLNGVLISKLRNILFASCYFINLDFFLLRIAHFGDSIALQFFIFKVGRSPSEKFCVTCFIEKSFKKGEERFLFYLKSSFCSPDIYVFIMTFWSCRKTAWSERSVLWIHDVITWLTNNCNTHIARRLNK